MSYVRPIDLHGMVQRAQDVSTIKQQGDNKPLQDQQNIQQTLHKNIEKSSKQVVPKDDMEYLKHDYDSKKKGNGQYSGQQKKKRQEEQQEEKERVVVKGQSHLDIKI